MTVDALLSRLERVRQTGPGRWQAQCPAHDDRGPSLSIRELDDGRVLVHDFAGCSVEQVLGAVALTFDTLYPPQPIGERPRERLPFAPLDALRAVAFEALIVVVSASAMARGETLTDRDRQRLLLAASRLQAAVEAVRHV